MYVAAQDAQRFARHRSRIDLDYDRQFLFALAKAVENIGEAASHISDSVKSTHQHIAWAQIIGMRHRLVHAFDDINFEVLWKTVADDLPLLSADLRPLLESNLP